MSPSAPQNTARRACSSVPTITNTKTPASLSSSTNAPVAAESHNGCVDPGVDTFGNVAAAQEWRQQVHHNRATGRTIPDLPDRLTEFIGRGKAECAQASSAGHCGRQFRTRQAAAHSGLADRHLQTQPV